MATRPVFSGSSRFRFAPTAAAVCAVALVSFAAYANSFSVPFLFDDHPGIVENGSVRHLWPFGSVLTPPNGGPTGGRPLLNLAFALNYAWGGVAVQSYHWVNLAIHLCAGLALFGLIRRTWRDASLALALSVTLIWALHPLQTESITYISQRAESLMGLFYLLTVYCFARGAEETERERTLVWHSLSCLACLLGMATKETMVTAPLLVLFYDRTFWSGSFRAALSNRRLYYLGLGSSWSLLWLLIFRSALSTRSVGLQTIVPWQVYSLTELKVLTKYMALCFWPTPLVFDYGTELYVKRVLEGAIWAIPALLAIAAAIVLWRRSRPAGFLAWSFFILLAPTSSFVPVAAQPMAENRLYLPLAAALSLAALGLTAIGGRRVVLALAIAAGSLGWLTWQRNSDYGSALGLWSDTVAKCPGNSRAQACLAGELARQRGREPEAIDHFERAIAISPNFAEVHYRFGSLLARLPGKSADAIAQFEAAVRIEPEFARAHNDLANELAKNPAQRPAAIAHYEEAVRINPNYAKAHYNLAVELARLPGHADEVIAHYLQALRAEPDFVPAHNNLAATYAQLGRWDEALAQWREALKLDPNDRIARANLAKFSQAGAAKKKPAAQ